MRVTIEVELTQEKTTPTDEVWSEDVPAEPGLYWTVQRNGLNPQIFERTETGEWIRGNWRLNPALHLFGPLIPSAEQLAAKDKELAELREENERLRYQVNAIIESCYYRTKAGKVQWKQGQSFGTSVADNTEAAAFEEAMQAIRRNAGIDEVMPREEEESTTLTSESVEVVREALALSENLPTLVSRYTKASITAEADEIVDELNGILDKQAAALSLLPAAEEKGASHA